MGGGGGVFAIWSHKNKHYLPLFFFSSFAFHSSSFSPSSLEWELNRRNITVTLDRMDYKKYITFFNRHTTASFFYRFLVLFINVDVSKSRKHDHLLPTVVVVDRFYIALFSALEQTHCDRMWFYMSLCLCQWPWTRPAGVAKCSIRHEPIQHVTSQSCSVVHWQRASQYGCAPQSSKSNPDRKKKTKKKTKCPVNRDGHIKVKRKYFSCKNSYRTSKSIP